MNLKWAALFLICTVLTKLSSGSSTQESSKIPRQIERSSAQVTAKVARHLDTYLKPPPIQQTRVAPPPPEPTSTTLPLMQRIARWFLSSETPVETHPRPNIAYPPQKSSQGHQKPLEQQKSGTQPQACRPCNKIPWMPMFPSKGVISDAVLSLIAGHNLGGGDDQHFGPKEPQFGAFSSVPSGGEQLSLPASGPQNYPTHTQAHFLTSLVPRPVNSGRPPLPPPPPPPPYRLPFQYSNIGNHRQPFSYLSPPFNRPSIYGQFRPSGGGQLGNTPTKEEITITIHENKDKPNGIYKIPGGPQIHLVSDFRPSGFGGTVEELKTNPSPNLPSITQSEIVPSVPIANYLSSIEYPMVMGQSHMMDLTNENPRDRPTVDTKTQGRLPSLSGPGSELPIHYSSPEKEHPFIGPRPSPESPPDFGSNDSHSLHYHSDGVENAHQSGPYVTEVPFPSPVPSYSSPAPPITSASTPYSSGPSVIYSTTHSPISHSGPADLPTVSSIYTSSSAPRAEGPVGYSSTARPIQSLSHGIDSSTSSPIEVNSPPSYSLQIVSSTESPKFSNSYSPPASTYVDIQPSLQTAEYLSSLSQGEKLANIAFKVHQGQGFRLPENYRSPSVNNQYHNTGHQQANLNVKGHFITKSPVSSTPSPKVQQPINNYQRPHPSPFKPPNQGNRNPSIPLAPNPALWTKDHPYSFEIPQADTSIISGAEEVSLNQNRDTVSTGSAQAQVPLKNIHYHHTIEEPPEFSFIHNVNNGHYSSGEGDISQGIVQQNKWKYTNENSGPSTVSPALSTSRRPSPFYGQPPTPFTTSTTAAPPVFISSGGFSASTPIPNFSSSGYSPSSANLAEDTQLRNKGKKTKQVQIIIPYITGGDKSKQLETALSSSVEHSVLPPGGKSNQEGSAIHKPNNSPSADNRLPHWHQNGHIDEDYHDHQESRTVTASAPHPNHLRLENCNDMKIEDQKNSGFQHVLASNLRQLLKGESEHPVSENPLFKLQKNIDAWTAQQYSGKPTASTSKEGLTTKSLISLFEDHEASGSNDHAATARPDGTIISSTTPGFRTTSGSNPSTFWGIHSNLVIPEIRSKSSNDSDNEEKLSTADEERQTTTTTAANWSQVKVGISPTTKEKVYVVTPMTVGIWDESPPTTTPKSRTSAHYTTPPPSITAAPSTSSVTVTSLGNPFTSPRFTVRPTPGVKTDSWPPNGVFVTTSTDASVRENAADISSNDIFPRADRARHKASEGTFAIYGPSGPPSALVTVPSPSYTLLPGTQVKTFAGHSRVTTSAASPAYSRTTSYSPSGRALSSQNREEENKISSGEKSSDRRIDQEVAEGVDETAKDDGGTLPPLPSGSSERRESFSEDYDIRHNPELATQKGISAAEEETTVKGIVVELNRTEPS